MKIYLILVLIFSICILFSFKKYNENFINKYSKINRPYIWLYWENINNKIRPKYLDLCYETILKNCSNSFNIILLNEKNIVEYLPNIRKDLSDKLVKIPMKVDYYRYNLLYKYGGIWIDFDTIIIKDLLPIYNLLRKYDYIGFGCYYNNKICLKKTGYPNPANWVLISRKKNIMFKKCIDECDRLLDKYSANFFKKNYHIFGKNLLPMAIKFCHDNIPDWKYLHFPSKCIERNSSGIKLTNELLISNSEIDTNCKKHYYFVPIYNTSPGFPSWFKNLSKVNIIKSNTLISKLFRYALKYDD